MEDSEPYSQVATVVSNMNPSEIDTFSLMVYLSVLLVLFILTALISASEIAFFSLQSSEQQSLNDKKSFNAKIAKSLLNHPYRLVATLYVSGAVVKLLSVIVSVYTATLFFSLGERPFVGLLLLLCLLGLVFLVIIEIPKSIASRKSLDFSLFAAPIIGFLSLIFRPISSLLINFTNIINRKIAGVKFNFSMGNISEALEISEASLNEEKNIIKGIVKFGNIYVSEIMCSRLDVIAVEYNTPFDELLVVVNESGFSRIPVYEETLDTIKGILYIKDLLPHLTGQENFDWQSLIRPSYYVPESKKINDLLKEFQKKHIHLAVVVDEYGGTSGIVTLEDIIEEIVGEISDESDSEQNYFERLDEKSILFEGKVLLNDFYKIVGVENDIFDAVKGEADTLAGLILELRGEIPVMNDKLSYRNFTFEIREADKRRIKRILVTVN